MLCPRCQAEIDLTQPACASCGVDLLQAFEERARAKPADAAAAGGEIDVQARPRGFGLRAALCIALAIVAGVAVWPRVFQGRPGLPRGRFALPDHHLSFEPPGGWTIEEVTPSGEGWEEILRFTRRPAVIQVLIRRSETTASAELVSRLAEERFAGAGVRVEGQERMEIAGHEAWSVKLAAEMAMLPSPSRSRGPSDPPPTTLVHESMAMQGQIVLVAGARRGYLIVMYSERGDFARQRPALQRFLERLHPL